MKVALLLCILTKIVSCITECDVSSIQLSAEKLQFDGAALNKCHHLVGLLEGCNDEGAQELRNKLLYKAGLIEMSLDQGMLAINSFESVANSNEDSLSSLAYRRLRELYQNYGIWEKIPDDEHYNEYTSLKDSVRSSLVSGKIPSQVEIDRLIEISPWNLDIRILYNDVLYTKLTEAADINTAQTIISNYEVILDKHKRNLMINDRLRIHYAITVLQLFVISTQPTHLKKCLILDMDYNPCRELSKIVSKMNKVNPPLASILHADEYSNIVDFDWNKVIDFYQKSTPFIKNKSYKNNLDLIKYLADEHVKNLLNKRPMSDWEIKLGRAHVPTDFDIVIDVILCEAYDFLSMQKYSTQYCDNVIERVVPSDDRKILKGVTSNLQDKDKAKEVLERLWKNYPHLAAHIVNSIINTLSATDRRSKNADTTPYWQLLESIVSEYKWNHSPSKFLNSMAVIVTRTMDSRNQQRQHRFYQQHQQQNRQQQMQQPVKTTNKDYYKILGVSKQADTKEIRKAYLLLTKKFHPDKQGQLSEAQQLKNQEKMSEINEAYETLSDDSKRKDYEMHRTDRSGSANARSFRQGQPFDFGNNGFKMNFDFSHSRRRNGH